MLHEKLTHTIIGCAYNVYNTLGFGFLESVYEEAMLIELSEAGLRAESQMPIIVEYKGEVVGEFAADIVVENEVIVELKSVRQLVAAHEVQLVNYLTATGKDVGLLINFGPEGVDPRRRVRVLES